MNKVEVVVELLVAEVEVVGVAIQTVILHHQTSKVVLNSTTTSKIITITSKTILDIAVDLKIHPKVVMTASMVASLAIQKVWAAAAAIPEWQEK